SGRSCTRPATRCPRPVQASPASGQHRPEADSVSCSTSGRGARRVTPRKEGPGRPTKEVGGEDLLGGRTRRAPREPARNQHRPEADSVSCSTSGRGARRVTPRKEGPGRPTKEVGGEDLLGGRTRRAPREPARTH